MEGIVRPLAPSLKASVDVALDLATLYQNNFDLIQSNAPLVRAAQVGFVCK